MAKAKKKKFTIGKIGDFTIQKWLDFSIVKSGGKITIYVNGIAVYGERTDE